jgi:hypothetical protein
LCHIFRLGGEAVLLTEKAEDYFVVAFIHFADIWLRIEKGEAYL